MMVNYTDLFNSEAALLLRINWPNLVIMFIFENTFLDSVCLYMFSVFF